MTFKLKHSLKKHQLVHKPEFGHTCDFCGKKFKVENANFLKLSKKNIKEIVTFKSRQLIFLRGED